MNQRLNQTITALKERRRIHSASDFARILGVDKGDLSRIVNGKRPISQRFVESVLENFPEVNADWLLNGAGEMLKNSAVADNQSISIAGEDIKENKINVNTDATIAALIAEVSAQRRLTEAALAEIAEQRKLTEAAIAKIG